MVAGSCGLVGIVGLRLSAFQGGMGTGIAAAAHMGVAAVLAAPARELVEVEAQSMGGEILC